MANAERMKMANFTQAAIKAAFIELLNERPINKITVKDIVERCGINRNSFYYHFQDIPALIEDLITENAQSIFDKQGDINSLEEALCTAADFICLNKNALLNIYHSENREIFENYLWKVSRYVVSKYIDSIFKDLKVKKDDEEIIIQLFESLCFGIAMSWFEDDLSGDIYDKIHRICLRQQEMRCIYEPETNQN